MVGFLTVKGATLTSEAIYHSNQAVLHQTLGSDKWAEFQAAAIKVRIVETALLTATSDDVKAKLSEQVTDLRGRQPPLKEEAVKEEASRNTEAAQSDLLRKQKGFLDYAGMSVQLAIALMSIAALTKRMEAFGLAMLCGLIGVAITGYALAYPFIMKH